MPRPHTVTHEGSEFTVYFDEKGKPETVNEYHDGYVSYSRNEPYREDKHGWLLKVEQHDVENDPFLQLLRRYESMLLENNYLRSQVAYLEHDKDKMFRAFVLHQEVNWK